MTQLREIPEVRQFPGEPHRRWFTSPTLDLFVWCGESGIPVGIQFTYDKGRRERALTWKPELGFVHDEVDDGESISTSKYKATPLLHADGKPDIEKILHLLLAHGTSVPPDIVSFLDTKIREYK
jgi:hypothetical protein